jgi:hypothetical protein
MVSAALDAAVTFHRSVPKDGFKLIASHLIENRHHTIQRLPFILDL